MAFQRGRRALGDSEREAVHLYAGGVGSTGQHSAQLSGKVGTAQSPQQLAGAQGCSEGWGHGEGMLELERNRKHR